MPRIHSGILRRASEAQVGAAVRGLGGRSYELDVGGGLDVQPGGLLSPKVESVPGFPPGEKSPDEGPLLSVIVTSYDLKRLGYLKRLIESLASQKCQAFESVFVIEKHPVMCRLIEDYAKSEGLNDIRTIFNSSKPGISASRNVGVISSKGRIVSMIDDDVVLPDTWVQNVISLFEDATIIGATGPVLPKWEDRSMEWIPPELHWLFGCSSWSGRNVLSETRNVWGANMAFRRSDLTKSGGFPPEIGGIHGKRLHGEENEVTLRVKRLSSGRVVFAPSMELEHSIPRQRLSMKPIIRSSYDMGRTRRIYSDNLPLLKEEVDVIARIVRNGICKSLLSLPVRPKESISVFSLSALVLTCSSIGFVKGMSA